MMALVLALLAGASLVASGVLFSRLRAVAAELDDAGRRHAELLAQARLAISESARLRESVAGLQATLARLRSASAVTPPGGRSPRNWPPR